MGVERFDRRRRMRATEWLDDKGRLELRRLQQPRASSGWLAAARGLGPLLFAAPLAAFTAVFVFGAGPGSEAVERKHPAQASFASGPDREAAAFARCGFGARVSCVIDGDTFWYRGEKIRIADINTPETSRPGCAREAELGAAATARLQALLNQGAFTLETVDRDRDKYGRLLRTVTRDGESLGAVLVDEGLAEEWRGYRRNWC